MTETQVATVEPREVQNAPVTPSDMLSMALQQGAGMDVLEKLMGLQERYDANQAKRAFDEAMAEAKARIPTIAKTEQGHNYKYESMATISETINPILAEFGLSYRYRTETEPDRIAVTCILSHRDGHSEENTLHSAPDTSGSKNSIQAIGSTVQYLQRYTLKAGLGLATGKDDDGNLADGFPRLNANQMKFWIRQEHVVQQIREAKTFKFLRNMRERLTQYTFLNIGFIEDCFREIAEREEEIDRANAGEEPKSTEPDKWKNILWEFGQQIAGATDAERSELVSEYAPLLDGAPDEVWMEFERIKEA